jgi:hypothetical protein
MNMMMTEFETGTLWAAWENELTERWRRRRSASLPVPRFDGAADATQYKRAWYYGGRKSDFFAALLDNIANPRFDLVQCLTESESELIRGFFAHWALVLAESAASPDQLKLLVALYRLEWQEHYEQIFPLLSAADLKFLLSKTSNRALRASLEQRLRQVSAESYMPPLAFDHAEKKRLRAIAHRHVQAVLARPKEPSLLLIAAEALFRAGDLDEALWIAYVLRCVDAQDQTHWTQHALWPKLVPLYALLTNRWAPLDMTERLNRQPFGGALPPGLSDYISLYQSLTIGMSLSYDFMPAEALAKTNRLLLRRPDDPALLYWRKRLTGQAGPDETLITAARQCIAVSPFESLTLLEMSRFLLLYGYEIPPSHRRRLRHLYQRLYQWLPAPFIWNQAISVALTEPSE